MNRNGALLVAILVGLALAWMGGCQQPETAAPTRSSATPPATSTPSPKAPILPVKPPTAGGFAVLDFDEVGRELATLLEDAHKGGTFDVWRQRPGIRCEEPSNDLFSRTPSEMWVHLCRAQAENWKATYWFHADVAADAITLQQLKLTLRHTQPVPEEDSFVCPTPGLSHETPPCHVDDEATNLLLSRLRERLVGILGPGTSDPGNDAGTVVGRGDCGNDGGRSRYGGWLWCDDTRKVLLYAAPAFSPSRAPEAEIVVESLWGPVRERIVADRLSIYGPSDLARNGLDWETLANVCEEAGYSGCRDLRESDWFLKEDKLTTAFCQAVSRLSKGQRFTEDDVPVMIWLDYLLSLLVVSKETGSLSLPPCAEDLVRLGIGLRMVEHEDPRFLSFEADRSYLARLAIDGCGSRWGEAAFKVMTESGWEPTHSYLGAGIEYPEVILRGEEFLDRCPSSPIRPTVVRAVAQAYETWWSMSKVSSDVLECWDPCELRPWAEHARHQAIAYYASYLSVPGLPASEIDETRLRLFLLRRDQDTSQRRFFFFSD